MELYSVFYFCSMEKMFSFEKNLKRRMFRTVLKISDRSNWLSFVDTSILINRFERSRPMNSSFFIFILPYTPHKYIKVFCSTYIKVLVCVMNIAKMDLGMFLFLRGLHTRKFS